ncbi:MAG TPA: response regulator transcription factor [Dehalococcoidia bacterium]|nr:response regulator transcription factor [Dehalococcoidia bacterium]
MSTILVVDDEPSILDLARLYLEKDGFRVVTATDGDQALQKHKELRPDLLVLDLMLPEVDGLEVCRRIRQSATTPILMLTARNDDVDKIVGLELGADDYMTKPFNPRELTARVKAILRRVEGGQRATRQIAVAGVHIDLDRREVKVDGRLVQLRAKEFDLLSALAQNAGLVLSRERLLEMVWGYDFYGETRTVDVHINHLREKLGDRQGIIETVRGVGYKLVDNA